MRGQRRVSSLEATVHSWLEELGVDYETEYPAPGGAADIYCPSLNLINRGCEERDALKDQLRREGGFQIMRLAEKEVKSASGFTNISAALLGE